MISYLGENYLGAGLPASVLAGLVEKHEGEVKKLQQSGEKDKKQICKLKEDLTKASKKISENNSEFRNTLDEQAAGHRRAEEEMRKDIELLSGQLSSLIENGEEYKKNVNRREVQFKKQIEELQSARKSDIKNFSKVRKAATAWQKKVAGTNTSKSTKPRKEYERVQNRGTYRRMVGLLAPPPRTPRKPNYAFLCF